MVTQLIIFLTMLVSPGQGELQSPDVESWRLSSSGEEVQFYTVDLVNSSVAGIRTEMLNNKYSENMKHEVRENVVLAAMDYALSLTSPREATYGKPTGKRQHKPW